ncbi:MAG: hypothetical protein J2P47_11845 [Acetobacteraceae bacterium]|nr:hypothetical protein [Acetobacteraceae bacterium]
MRRALLTASLLALAACSHLPSETQSSPVPTIQYRANPANAPGYVSPCSGGMPQMQYNCPDMGH